MQISVTVTGLDKVNERLGMLGKSFHDFTAAFEILKTQLILFYGDTVFVSSGAALASRWASLASSTQAEKNKRWPGRGILERTGTMKKGFKGMVRPESLIITNDVSYFPFHQLGTSHGLGRGHNIPARRMLGVNDAVKLMIKDVIAKDIKAKIELTNGR